MDTLGGDIESGLDVYGSDGAKIGTVADVRPAPAGAPVKGSEARLENFSGVLGDESRVVGGPTSQATGILGDETRTTGSSGAGRPETMSDRPMGAAPVASSPETDTGYAPADVDETEVVVVEGAMVDTLPAGMGQSGTQMGYAPAATSFFQVDQGGILGIGAKQLYVPYSAVQTVSPGDRVILSCSKDQAGAMYTERPDIAGSNG